MIGALPFSQALAPFAGGLRWREGAEPLGAEPIGLALARFHISTGGPWRAACSLWAQSYFNALLIPATCALAAGWRDDALAAEIAPRFCPTKGAPRHFVVAGERRASPPPAAEQAVLDLLDAHLARVIADLSREARLSPRMLWETAERTLSWASRQVAREEPSCLKRLEDIASRASAPRLAQGWLWNAGAEPCRRRFCCLRHQLADFVACPQICPRARERC